MSSAHTRVMVVSGIPKLCDAESVKRAIRRCAKQAGTHFLLSPPQAPLLLVSSLIVYYKKSLMFVGGIYKNEIFLPFAKNEESAASLAKPTDQPSSEPTTSERAAREHAQPTSSKPRDSDVSAPAQLRGFAVFSARARCCVDSLRKALLKNKTFLDEVELLTPSQEDAAGASGSAALRNMATKRLTITTVNKQLQADVTFHSLGEVKADQSDVTNVAMEAYLQWKLLSSRHDRLSDVTVSALTDIFHSCYVTDEHVSVMTSSVGGEVEGRDGEGFICLSPSQILLRENSNLLSSFFTAMATAKSTSTERVVKEMLACYGVARSEEKEE